MALFGNLARGRANSNNVEGYTSIDNLLEGGPRVITLNDVDRKPTRGRAKSNNVEGYTSIENLARGRAKSHNFEGCR